MSPVRKQKRWEKNKIFEFLPFCYLHTFENYEMNVLICTLIP